MREFLFRYPYFGTSLLVTVLCLAGMILFPRHRNTTWLSAIVAIPWAIWSLFLVPEYWTPRSLVHLGRLGIEDFLWAFGTGGLAWLSAVVLSRRTVFFHWHAARFFKRLLASFAIGFAVFISLFLNSVQGMIAFALSVGVLGAFLAMLRPGNLKLALAGSFGFGVINFVVTEIAVLFCSDYFRQMNPSGLSGRVLINLPVEEVYWAFATGATWPLLVCYAFDGRFASNEKVETGVQFDCRATTPNRAMEDSE